MALALVGVAVSTWPAVPVATVLARVPVAVPVTETRCAGVALRAGGTGLGLIAVLVLVHVVGDVPGGVLQPAVRVQREVGAHVRQGVRQPGQELAGRRG